MVCRWKFSAWKRPAAERLLSTISRTAERIRTIPTKSLNVNELADALRPAVVQGMEMRVHIGREGKEAGQGVAFLDDGTMIVIEGGKSRIGGDADITVTSVLQTSAGRMIFAKLK